MSLERDTQKSCRTGKVSRVGAGPSDVELITIRHYTKEIVDKLIGERTVFVEQRNRLTARFVVPVERR